MSYSQDSLKSTLGLGISVNKYWLSTFENYSVSAGKFVSDRRELGINFRYFRSEREPGRLINRIPEEVDFYQFQSNFYLKYHSNFHGINLYRYSEFGLQFTNSTNRNGDELLSNKQKNYHWPNLSFGLGTEYYFGKRKKFGLDGNFFLSNSKYRTSNSDFRDVIFNNFFIVANASAHAKLKL